MTLYRVERMVVIGREVGAIVNPILQNKRVAHYNEKTTNIPFQSEYSVGQINPVEVEGQTDVHGAEQVFTGPSVIPQYTNRPSLKMW